MSGNTSIEWSEKVWNPATGCTVVSPGCVHCYAKTFAERWRGVIGHPYEMGFDLTLRPERLEDPLHWKKPCKIFVNSMSDLFHEDIPEAFIARVFTTMRRAHWHTFQVLTKRAVRMQAVISRLWREDGIVWPGPGPGGFSMAPLPNVWLGVSVEDQKAADERIPLLSHTPAAIRFLSCEPLLGPVDIFEPMMSLKGIDWVICGGESGHGAREMHLDWARGLRDQCGQSGVAFFMKQLGGRTDKKGSLHQIPEDLRIRQWPAISGASK